MREMSEYIDNENNRKEVISREELMKDYKPEPKNPYEGKPYKIPKEKIQHSSSSKSLGDGKERKKSVNQMIKEIRKSQA